MNKKVKEAIHHYNYGIKCDIFKEPVITYAKLAIEAMEKQLLAKNVIKIFDESVKTYWCKCPCCGKGIGWFTATLPKHCPECGQRIEK